MLNAVALIIFHQSDLFALYFFEYLFFFKRISESLTLDFPSNVVVLLFNFQWALRLLSLTARLLYHFLTSLVNTFFKTFLSFFHLFLPSGFCRYILCFRHTPPQNSLRSFQLLFLIVRIFWANNSRWRVFYKKYFCFLHPEKKTCDIFSAKGNSWYLHTFLCQGR